MVDHSKVELLACPFCGENEIVQTEVWSGFHGKWVNTQECKCCGAAAPIEVWSQRYSSSPQTEQQPSEQVSVTMRLPCEVKLPGGMTIGRGCQLSTLLRAMQGRENDPMWRQRFGQPMPFDPALHNLIAAPVALSAPQPEQSGLVAALEYYARGDHLLLADPDEWDTCSGEPANFLHDEAGTASVEDGSIAKVALEAYRAALSAQGGEA